MKTPRTIHYDRYENIPHKRGGVYEDAYKSYLEEKNAANVSEDFKPEFRSVVEAEAVVYDKLTREGYEIAKKGWPDFLAYNEKDQKLRFIEVKYAHQHLRPQQKHVKKLFEKAGLDYEVIRVSIIDGKLVVEDEK